MKKTKPCEGCGFPCTFVTFKRHKDGFAWRCNKSGCQYFKNYYSIRENSFFKSFRISLIDVLDILMGFGTRRGRFSILETLKHISKNAIDNVLMEIKNRIPETNFSTNKLGRPGKIV